MNVSCYDGIVTWSLFISDKSWVSTRQVKWSNEIEMKVLTVWLCIILKTYNILYNMICIFYVPVKSISESKKINYFC